jgi:hypothetical protein
MKGGGFPGSGRMEKTVNSVARLEENAALLDDI